MKTRNDTNKHRLFFYGTFAPLVIMLGLMYTQYKDNEQTVFDTHKRSSRQLQLTAISWQARVDDMTLQHMAISHKLQEHHTHEIDQLITYYSEMIEDIISKEPKE